MTKPPSTARFKPAAWLWIVWTVLAVASYLYLNRGYAQNVLYPDQSLTKSLGQAGLIAMGFVALVLGPLALRSAWVFVPLAAVCLASVTTNLVIKELMVEFLTRDTAIWLFAERHQIHNAWAMWWPTVLKLLALAVVLLGAIYLLARAIRNQLEQTWGPARARQVRAAAVVLFLLIPVALVAARLRGGLAESNLLAFSINAAMLGDPQTRALTVKPVQPPLARNIILLMDESTRHEAFAKVVTPTLPRDAVDFGLAFSISGCSAASNALMRWGLTRTDGNVDDPRSNPSLWAYAKAAGMRTVMIDGQMTTTQDSHNLFLRSEFPLIDDRRAMDIGIETDSTIARALAEITRQPGSHFIYVVLRGNHVPYAQNNLPPAMRDLGGSVEVVYERSVAYTTGRMFASLLDKASLAPDTLVAYTSDHGQELRAAVPHCHRNAPESHFEVPMVIVPGPNTAWADALRASAACWRGGANHQNLRSTVLEAMGYARDDIEREGFQSLSHCPRERQMPRFRGEMPFVSAKGDSLRYEWLPFRNP